MKGNRLNKNKCYRDLGACRPYIIRDMVFTVKRINLTVHLRGPIKAKTKFCMICPSKLAPKRIEFEILRGANSKIPSQPLGQPLMSILLGMKKIETLITCLKRTNPLPLKSLFLVTITT